MFDTLRDYARMPKPFTGIFRKIYLIVSKTVKSERHREVFMSDFVSFLRRSHFNEIKFIRHLKMLYGKLSKFNDADMNRKSTRRARARVNDVQWSLTHMHKK